MSACSGSERVPRRATLLAASVACVALAIAGTPAVASSRDADSVRAASRITITDDGITIHRRGGGTILEESRPGKRLRDVIAEHESTSTHLTNGGRVHIGNGSIVVDGSDAGVVRMFSDVTVERGERVDGDVVVLFGSVDVRGQIDGNVVAVLGSIRLEPGAKIDGDAVAVGGGLDQETGANVTGESVSLHFLPISPGVPPLRALMLMVLCGWLFAILAGTLLWLVAPKRMVRIADTAVHRTGASLVVGLLLPPLSVILGVLLMITVIGIPFALLIPVFCLIVAWAGQVATSYLVGCRLLQRPLGAGGYVGPTFMGALLVAMLFALGAALAGPGAMRSLSLFFTMVGVLFSLVFTVLGSGAAVVSGFGSARRAKDAVEAAPVAAAPIGPAPAASPAAPPVA
jgi:hypothetical protein